MKAMVWVVIIVVVVAGLLAARNLVVPKKQPQPNPVKQSGLLKVGDQAPDFSLPDKAGTRHGLVEHRGKEWVVLAFYPADMTSGCTMEAHSIQQNYEKLNKMKVQTYSISTQDIDSKKKFCAKEGLTYPLLADVGGVVAKQYGVKLMMGKWAERITFVVDPQGIIRHVYDKVNVQSHGSDLIALIKGMQEEKG